MTIDVTLDSPILTICRAGIDRSVCLKEELIKRHYSNVINCGVYTVRPETLQMLGDWAKLILVIAEEEVWNKIPWDLKGKAVFDNVGPDVWHNPNNPELVKICKKFADSLKL